MPNLIHQTFKQKKQGGPVDCSTVRIKVKGLNTTARATSRPRLFYAVPAGVPATVLAEFHKTYKLAIVDCEDAENPHGEKVWAYIVAVYSTVTGEFHWATPYFRSQDARAAAAEAVAFQRGGCCGWSIESDMGLKCILVQQEVLIGSFFFECAVARWNETREQATLLGYFAKHATSLTPPKHATGPTLDEHATGPTLDEATSDLVHM